MEILIVGVILMLLFNYLGAFSFNKFVEDNNVLFGKLKEDDYNYSKSWNWQGKETT